MRTKNQVFFCEQCKREWRLPVRPAWLFNLRVVLEGEGGAVLLSKDVCSQECAAQALRDLEEKLEAEPTQVGIWREEEELEEVGFLEGDEDEDLDEGSSPWAFYEEDDDSDAAGCLETGD